MVYEAMDRVPKVLLSIEISRGYGRQLLRGIARYSKLRGPWSFHLKSPFDVDFGRREKRPNHIPHNSDISFLAKDWPADGIIMREQNVTDDFLRLGVPVIIASWLKEKLQTPCIQTDCDTIGKIAAEHFLDMGFKNFAYCGFDKVFWSRRRADSFCRRGNIAGLKVDMYEQPKNKKHCTWNQERHYVANWLKSLPKPVAIMACNDNRARDVVESCRISGLMVPDEVAVLGVDNDEFLCHFTEPALSSISLGLEKAGYQAAALLDQLMAGEQTSKQTIIVPALYVVKRTSTDILAVTDSLVSKALKFIRQRAPQMQIQVPDVMDACAASRRVMERRFKKVIGRSVNDEIRRVRVEQFCRMLLETDMPVYQIALALNFPSTEHISRYFRKEKGMSPLEYRRRYAADLHPYNSSERLLYSDHGESKQ